MARRRFTVKPLALFLGILAIILLLLQPVAAELWSGGRDALQNADSYASVAAVVIGALALLVQVWPSRSGDVDQQRMVEDAERSLRERVRENSKREQDTWGINDPHPLPVRWHVVADAVDHRSNIYGTTGETRYEDLTAHGTFSAVRQFYRSIPSQRMVIQGDPGSGKTVLAHHLITTLLDNPEGDQPIPVLFSVNTWNPNNTGLSEWLIKQLSRDYPHLGGEHSTRRTLSAVLVRRDRILPVLDGFDEIPQKFRSDAIDALSRFDGPLIVTTRRDQYLAATGKARAIGRAEAIALDPLSLDDVSRYLHDSTGTTQAAAWTRVFDRLQAEPDAPGCRALATVLSVPLMVSLARSIYRTADHGTPTDLLDISRSSGRTGLEEHLLDSYIDTVYDPRHTPNDDDDKKPSWAPNQARRWLGYLASISGDLAWWELGSPIPRVTRALITGLVGMAAGGLIGGLAYNLAEIFEFLILAGDPVYFVTNNGLERAEALTGLALGFIIGIFNDIKIGGINLARSPEKLRLKVWRRDMARSRPAGVLPRHATEAALGALLGFAIGAASVMTWAYTTGFGQTYAIDLASLFLGKALAESPIGFQNELIAASILGISVGAGYALVNAVVHSFGEREDPAVAVNPWQSLLTDRAVVLFRAGIVVLAVGIIIGFVKGFAYGSYNHDWPWAVDSGTDYGVLYGLLAGLTRFLLSAWGSWLIVGRLWLPLTGRLSWTPKRFLEDAYERGILRQAGAVYQFRHPRLREYLANQHHNKPKRMPPDSKDVIPVPEPH